jgi:hypothetical protein
MLPSLGRVRVEVARDRVLVIEEIHLPRGDWRSGDLEIYVAFGSPGPPIAVDARLLALPQGDAAGRPDLASLAGLASVASEPVALQTAARAGPRVQTVLGRRLMAGVTIHVKESELRRAFAPSDTAVLRVRSLLHPPAIDDEGARDVVVRLGASESLPITLGHIEVSSLEKTPAVSRIRASLCGPEADPWPLSVALVPKAQNVSDAVARTAISPSLALRHASDDLCIRWWSVP